MKLTVKPPRYQKERQLTDESLTVERGDVTVAYVHNAVKTEDETDQAVKKDRLRADEARAKMRTAADESAQGGLPEQSTEQREFHRNKEDERIEVLRLKIDTAMEREREVKHDQIETLMNQRKDTDKNLSSERDIADSRATEAEGLLLDEKKAHHGTRAELTTREEFLAIVSHDLKNPVGAISNCADLLLSETADYSFDEKTRPLIEMMKRNADSSLRLINDLLDVERMSHNKIELQLEAINLTELVNEALCTLSHAAKTKNLDLKSLPLKMDSLVRCDRDRTARVLSNLIGNAIKFTPSGGSINLAVVELKDLYQVSITDTGPGIPLDKQPRVFDRFAQLKNKSRQGLGLGLFISKSLVELQGGTLKLESIEGKGCEFIFTLPKAHEITAPMAH